MQDMDLAIQFIDDNQNIDVLPSPDFNQDSFPAALALFYSLKQLNKNVNLRADKWPTEFEFLFKKDSPSKQESDFLITINEKRAKIAEIFYEKNGMGLKFFLKTNGGEIKKEDISLTALKQPADLLIAIGIKENKTISQLINTKPALIINIDNNAENQNYGHANLIDMSAAVFSETIFDLLCFLNEKLITGNTANALLAGIVYGTGNFQDQRTNAKTLDITSCLLEKGADLKETTTRFYGPVKEEELKVLGQVLNKINFSRELNVAWAMLKEGDFSQIKASAVDLGFTLRKLSLGLLPLASFFLLWERASSPLRVQGIFYSNNLKTLKKIIRRFPGAQKGNGILFKTEESNLGAVRDQVLEALKPLN